MAKRRLPPDPDKMNAKRTKWADKAIVNFMLDTGTDLEDAPCDLLADLMHWCDRHHIDFASQLRRAQYHYGEETLGKGGI